jgi:hypothetical protein
MVKDVEGDLEGDALGDAVQKRVTLADGGGAELCGTLPSRPAGQGYAERRAGARCQSPPVRRRGAGID